jgi:nucleotide-binding universal stress UspA family protein
MQTAITIEKRSRPPFGARKSAFSEILAPTDFSSRSDSALTYAIELAKQLGAHLTLMHAVPAPYAIDYTLGGIPNGDWEQALHDAEGKLNAALERIRIRYGRVDALVRVGSDLHEEIVSAAREVQADLVVLSTHGYKGWKLLLFGSDVDELLLEIPCPVLVVR